MGVVVKTRDLRVASGFVAFVYLFDLVVFGVVALSGNFVVLVAHCFTFGGLFSGRGLWFVLDFLCIRFIDVD